MLNPMDINGYNMVVLQFRMDQAGGTMRRIMNENSCMPALDELSLLSKR